MYYWRAIQGPPIIIGGDIFVYQILGALPPNPQYIWGLTAPNNVTKYHNKGARRAPKAVVFSVILCKDIGAVPQSLHLNNRVHTLLLSNKTGSSRPSFIMCVSVI